MDNWNVLAAQTSSSAIGRDDVNLASKEKLVSGKNTFLSIYIYIYLPFSHYLLFVISEQELFCSKQKGTQNKNYS